ncbi:TetR/AcrR family transcriptional regulator [Pseudofrankia asymbiotica]|uniref:TetR family transcriptional regulator n=1 Tax=Pseudofrankia asymbiotica TaxID=1834516 RepID=A0A1V2I1F2_9ACTN|nr:TetR/AcrR family transcriptional regulator [Pseudofrankia asymbiotica]ONH23294.1 TetR family transcriptional regulator [Pseudofrankia asymbiotica]
MAELRQRKRAEARQRISDRATRLFERHGFEKVTLAEIAAAADVSVKTVMNYFGAKEDLFFDAEPAICDELAAAVSRRGPTSATSALRPLIVESPILAGPCPWDSIDDAMWDSMRVWAECEWNSPTLRARRASLLQSWMAPLTAASGSAAWAAMLIGVLLLRHAVVQDGLIGRQTPNEVERHVRSAVGEALDALERGFQATDRRDS